MTIPDPLRAALHNLVVMARPFMTDEPQRLAMMEAEEALASIPAPAPTLGPLMPTTMGPDQHDKTLPASALEGSAPAPISPAPTVWYQCSACGWASAMGPDCEHPKDCPACGVTYMKGPKARGPWLSGPWAVDPRTLDSTPALDRREVVTSEYVAAEAYQVIGILADAVDLFDHPEIIRALDYFSLNGQNGLDGELLPWGEGIIAALQSSGGEVMAELLKCPFGCTTSPHVTKGGVCHWVFCSGCRCEGPSCPTENEAIAAWNRRAPTIEAQDSRCSDGGLETTSGAQVGPAAERPTLSAEDVRELRKLRDFLNGVGKLDGKYFGERLIGQPPYWWRASLECISRVADAIDRASPPLGEVGELVKRLRGAGIRPPLLIETTCRLFNEAADALERLALLVGGDFSSLPPTTEPAALSDEEGAVSVPGAIRELYRMEINSGVSSFWDGGWTAWIGDDLGNGRYDEASFLSEDFDQIGPWLIGAADRQIEKWRAEGRVVERRSSLRLVDAPSTPPQDASSTFREAGAAGEQATCPNPSNPHPGGEDV